MSSVNKDEAGRNGGKGGKETLIGIIVAIVIVVIFAEVSVYDVMHLGLSTLSALFIGFICQNMHVYKELMIHIKLMVL